MGKKEQIGLFLSGKQFLQRNFKCLAICALTAFTALMVIATTPSMQRQDQSQSKKKWSSNNDNCRWRPEPLQGTCDIIQSTEASRLYDNAIDCEAACCENLSCYSFQFRTKEGCTWGVGDTRLGAEKDGPSAWCEPRAPTRWQGQWIKSPNEGVPVIPDACNDDGWNPNELVGQCFGLGGRKQSVTDHTARACRDACCTDPDCRIWQWTADAGCFYNSNGFSCKEANPLDFEPYIGKRKVQPGRTYTPYAYSEDFANMAGIENVATT